MKRMITWMLAATLGLLALGGAMCIVSLQTYGLSGVARLWGFAPHQYFYWIAIMPFAAFLSILAFRMSSLELAADQSTTGALRPLYTHWQVTLLIALICSAILTIVFYFTAPYTFDKLKAPYANRAVMSAIAIQSELDRQSNAVERERRRKTLVDQGQTELSQVIQKGSGVERLDSLSNSGYLQAVQDPKLQRQFGLLDDGLRAMNTLQSLIGFFVGLMALAAAAYTILVGTQASSSSLSIVRQAADVSFVSVLLFGLYLVCYRQARDELSQFLPSTTPQFAPHLVGFVVLIVTLGFLSTRSSNTWLLLGCVAVLVILLLTQWMRPEVLQPVIGITSSSGTMITLLVACWLCLSFACVWFCARAFSTGVLSVK